MSEASYGGGLTTFSPTGKLIQLEYALTAVASGATALGLKARNGVVIATEKKVSPLMDENSVQKIAKITENIGVVYSGMGPDYRVIVRKARKKAEVYHRFYKDTMPVTQLVQEVASLMQEFTQRGGVRPFGVSLLVCGWDDNGPQLYQVDPSGSFFAWKASAIGKGMVQAKQFLEKRYEENLEIDDAIIRTLLTLKEGFDGQLNENNVEVAIIQEDRKFKILTKEQKQVYISHLE